MTLKKYCKALYNLSCDYVTLSFFFENDDGSEFMIIIWASF